MLPRIICLVVSALVASGPLLAGWQLVGQVGGPVKAIAVTGNLAFAGVGLRLVVLDVSDPSVLTEVGVSSPFPHFVQGVAVSGRFAYLATGSAGLRVVDIADPAQPVEVGAWDSPGFAEAVAVAGSTAYVADGPYGLRIVDVSDPAHPFEKSCAYPFNYAFDVAVAGHHAYVAAAGAGLLVVDAIDPTRPTELASVDTPGFSYAVALSGAMAVVADGWAGVQLVDVTDPEFPVLIAACATPGWALDVSAEGRLAVVADGSDGVSVLDLGDPTDPREVGLFETTGRARKVCMAGSVSLVADDWAGLRAIDLHDPAKPAAVGFYGAPPHARKVTVAPPFVYVAAGYAGLRVVDASDPARPREVGSYLTGNYVPSVAASGQYAYVAANPSHQISLHVLDVSDPTHPRKVAALATSGEYHDLVVSGNVLYVADGAGLRIIDVSNPVAPREFGFILLEGPSGVNTQSVTLAGTLAVVGTERGIAIVDVSNPSKPKLLGSYNPERGAQAGVAANDKLYVAASGGLRVVDISDPASPVELGFVETPGASRPWSVALDSSEVWVSDGGHGVQIADVSDPRHPQIVDGYDTHGLTSYLALAGGLAYLADGCGGVLILRRDSATPPTPTAWVADSTGPPGSPAPRLESRLTHVPAAERAPLRALAPGIYRRVGSRLGEAASGARGDSASGPSRGAQGKTLATSGVCVVNSTADSGAGTLRDCLENAGVGAKITFDPTIFPPSNPATIAPTTWLPVITQGGVTIDASNAGVILDGSRVPSDVWRHALSLDSDGNRVMGLQLTGWRGPAIAISGCWNVIGGDRSSGQGPSGQGNVISGNMHGISLDDKADHNRVIGNLIGTDVTGIEAVGNQVTGIGIAGCWNVIGPGQSDGSGPSGQGNVISGNMLGIGLYGKAAHNLVIGNLIGTDITGTKAIGNWASGIRLDPSASYNRIGGSTPQERNIISGNGLGVYLFGPGIVGNIVSGNYIGTDILGTNALGKGTAAGIGIEDGPRDTVIGGTNPGEGNVISGNEGGGIGIAGPATSQTNVIGNLIGLDASGSVALPNGGRGVSLLATAFNRIGGTSPGERNVIGWGIGIGGNEGGDNVVVGNYIGTDTSGGRGLGEGSYVGIGDARTHNFVGGSTTQERNVVGFIAIEGAGAEFNWVMGNYVGVAADGRKSLGHPALGHGAGVLIWQYAGNNVVQQNVVSGNDRCGVTLWNGAGSNLLRANRIGVAADGVSPLPNGETDIAVNGPENRIGGFRPGDGNTIAFSLEGVVVYGHPGNTIRGNSIYGHPGPGIELRGGNAGLAAPVITTVTPNSVCGTACPGCTVDVYSDSDDEGRIWEGSVTAAASTDFTFVKQGFTGPLVTATATDPSGNTSPLSSPRRTVRQRSRRHDRN